MNVRQNLKRFALRFLPDRVLQRIKKTHYAAKLRATTDDREPDLKVVRHLVPPGGVAVDLGANFGVYTRFLSELVGATGQVYSVEPVPLTFEILASNVRALGLANVELLNVAVSSADGAVRMEVPRYASGGENFYEAHIVADEGVEDRRCVPVEARSLDSLFGHLRDGIDFIKCDVEGHELSALKGAVDLLRKVKPAWLIEVSGSPDNEQSPAREVFALLAERGYEPFWFDGTRLRPRQTGERSVNYFFLTRRHLRALPPELLPAGEDDKVTG